MTEQRPSNPEAYSLHSPEMRVTYKCALRWKRAATIMNRFGGFGNVRVDFDPNELLDSQRSVNVQLHFNSPRGLHAWHTVCDALVSARKHIELLEQEQMARLERSDRSRIFKKHLTDGIKKLKSSSSSSSSGTTYEE